MKLKFSIIQLLSYSIILLFAVPLKAQVTIGAQKAPHSYSVLELASAKGGLRLPMLNTSERDALNLTSDSTEANGLFIYNTDINCVEFWSDSTWIDLCSNTPSSSTPNSISLISAVGTDAQIVCGGTAITPITYAITGATDAKFIGLPAGVTGSWTRGSNTIIISGRPVTSGNYIVILTGGSESGMAIGTITVNQILSAISGSNGVTKGATDLIYSVAPVPGVTTYTWTVPEDWSITAGQGTDSIKVTAGTTEGAAGAITVSTNNGNCTGTSTLSVSVGCPVKTSSGGWLTFMCYNLGAATAVQSLSPADQAKYATPADEYGDLYQWGRQADGHQLRSNTVTNGGAVNGGTDSRDISYDDNSQIPVGDMWYGVPVYFKGGIYDWHGNSRNFINDNLWNFSVYPDNNPCPSGWRVPTTTELQCINDNTTTYNTWSWNASGTRGYLITPSGSSVPTLFLPAAGYRVSNYGEIYEVGTGGYYWSTSVTVSDTNAYSLSFNSSAVNPNNNNGRANAFSVRCIADQ